MGSGTGPAATTERSPLWAALDAEIVTLEKMVSRAWQIMAGGCTLVAGVVALFIAPGMGKAFLLMSAIMMAWATGVRAVLDVPRLARVVRWIAPVVEMAVPTAALLLIARTQGAGYALASWVPPVLFALILFIAVVRLKPLLPFVMGTAGSVLYVAIYELEISKAPLDQIDAMIANPRMQMIRAASIMLLGATGTIATIALRRAIGVAARRSRATDLFGKYRLGAQIAAGGMGVVYEALYCPEGGFQRRVAIKRVHAHLAQEPKAVAAFRAEAELCARLAHPNIVAVLDFGRTEDTYFFAMEHVDGMDLLRLRKACKGAGVMIPTKLVAFVGREIAEGLSFAHEAALDVDGRHLRVVHRDLNPSNVLVSRTGQVKISDFGIAKALRDSNEYDTASLVGKVPYFAPEQARGEAVDERVDLYALGLVLWELLCRRPLWKRTTDAETLLAILNAEAPPPSTVRAELAGGPWDAICTKALHPDRTRRFQSAREMALALSKILDDEGSARPDDLAQFVKSVETAPAISDEELPTTFGSDAETVREERPA
jgi:serine/threonine-protein kinase